MRGRPAIVVITLIISCLALVAASNGMFNFLQIVVRSWDRGLSISFFALHFTRLISTMAISGGAAYACLKRPPWGRVVVTAFAMVVSAIALFGLAFPDPNPPFPIEGPAEEAGATVSTWLMAVGIAIYAYKMAFGRKAREYFSGEISSQPGRG